MTYHRSNLFNFNLYLIYLLAFSGYYIGLMLVSNMASTSISRYFTIPVRFVIVACVLYLYFRSRQNLRNPGYIAFNIFAGIYLIRIIYEIVFSVREFYMPPLEFLLYFTSFVLLPFNLIASTNFLSCDYRNITRAIIVSSLGLSLCTYFYYGDLIGQVSRISQEIKYGENYISPLALSYCGSLGIGVGGAYLLTNKTAIKDKMLTWLTILSCLVPFFLGASRGSVLALGAPFIFYFVFASGLKRRLRLLIATGIGIYIFIYATGYFGTGVFDRFLGIEEAIESGSSGAGRLDIWKADLYQFLNNPLFGNSLESEYAHHYSHNILIESLITTGVLGFIPLSIFIFYTFMKVKNVIKYSPEYFWVTVIFIQAIVQYMFSGAIWGMSWVAIGAGLTLGFSIRNVQ